MSQTLEALLGGGTLLALRTGARRPPPPVDRAVGRTLGLPLWYGLDLIRRGLVEGVPGVVACRELANKLHVFDSFHRREPARPGSGLGARVRSAWREPSLDRLWATEGVGFGHAEAAWQGREPPRRLLAGPLPDVPPAAMLPIHTGMGLLLASRWLWLSGASGGAALRRRDLESFRALCRGNAGPGFGDAVFEALGFVARNLHPWRVGELAGLAAGLGAGTEALFWHGAGRGLYFSPARFRPGGTEAAFARALAEPPDAAGRANAVSGLAWALTLTNLPSPEVPARLLGRERRELTGLDPALGQGIASALWIWHKAHGIDPYLAAFLGYRAGDGGLWKALVVEPFGERLARPPGAPEELFRLPSSGPDRR